MASKGLPQKYIPITKSKRISRREKSGRCHPHRVIRMDINRNGTDGNPAPPVDCSKDTASQNRPVEFPPEMQDLNLAVRNIRQSQTEGLPTIVRWWECRGNAKELL